MVKYFECACHSPEHRLVFQLETEIGERPELYTEIHLHNHNNIFKRIWIAIKYVFGYKSKYGCFDCFLMVDPKEAERLRDIAHQFVTSYQSFTLSSGRK